MENRQQWVQEQAAAGDYIHLTLHGGRTHIGHLGDHNPAAGTFTVHTGGGNTTTVRYDAVLAILPALG